MRSVVNRYDPGGIAAIVEQQFALAEQVADHRMDDAAFERALGSAIAQIYDGSTVKREA
ncbi:hypothetical protein [Sphingomonas sp. UYP23]